MEIQRDMDVNVSLNTTAKLEHHMNNFTPVRGGSAVKSTTDFHF